MTTVHFYMAGLRQYCFKTLFFFLGRYFKLQSFCIYIQDKKISFKKTKFSIPSFIPVTNRIHNSVPF